jgi:hypothetical protein
MMKRVHRLFAQAFVPNPNNLDMVDHIDGNKTNNRLSNLRWVTRSQNQHNRVNAKGYYWNKQSNKWHAQLSIEYKLRYLGSFNTEAEARAAYLGASELLFPGVKTAV